MNGRRLAAIARKEAIQLRRDPRSLALAFLLPLLLIIFFGYAISWDVDDIELVVFDQNRTLASHRLVEAFQSSGYFTVTEYLPGYGDVETAIQSGRVLVGLVIPTDFAARLDAAAGAPLQLLLDGSDANTASIARSYAEAIVQRYAADIVLQGRELSLPVTAETRVWYNPTLASRNMIVPGLIAVIMSIISAMLTALTIAREWERGTMEQLAATPVKRAEVILGKLVPYFAIGIFDVALAAAIGIVLFDVPFRGSLPLLAVLTIFFLIGALGLGIFISAAFRSQVVATQVAVIVTYLPALLLSGFMFDIATMPAVLQAVTYVIPARYFIVVTRGIFLKGVGAGVLWIQGLSMILFATIGLGLAIFTFRKEIA